MRINGFAFVIIGTVVTVISKLLNSSKLLLFLYVGIILGLFGILRLVMDSFASKNSHPAHSSPNQFVTTHHRITKNQAFSYCPNCGSQLLANARFCPRCGFRIG